MDVLDLGEPLHPVEVDLLCTFAEVAAPFPLEIPATGQTLLERTVRYAGAREQLTERGLADEQGPLGVAEDFVFLLRSSTGALDLMLATERVELAAVVLSYRDEALLVTQDGADPSGMVRFKACGLDVAVADLLSLVPPVDPPMTAPFSLPRRALEHAFQVMLDRLPDPADAQRDDGHDPLARAEPMSAQEIDELLHSHGIDDRVARRMIAHLQPVLGNGQIGVARRDDSQDQWQRVGAELRWLDTTRGRYRLAGDADWLSVHPLPREEIRGEIRRFAATARG